ncbi:ATP-binding cassette domain-containing protein [Pseudomonas syringae]|nr:ATP-binding cassette domain-containing protein [Pseudomonas syringae]
MSKPILELKEIDVFYGPIQALKKVSLHINEGETVSLIGSNGAGKSTLLMSISVSRAGQRADHLSGHRHHPEVLALHRLQRHCAVAGGEAGLSRHVGRRKPDDGHHPDWRQAFGRRHAAHVRAVPRLKERRNQRAMTMSGGEQQMLAIARALMSRPKLLLLDEPSLGLAPIIVKQIFSTLRELAATGMTIFPGRAERQPCAQAV